MTQMTCEQFEALLPQLLDDDAFASLPPAARAHIDDCDACGALLADLTDIRAEAAALPDLVPSRDLWSGIAARIEAPVLPMPAGTIVRQPRRTMSWRTAGVAAAALVVVSTGATYLATSRTPSPEPMTAAAPQWLGSESKTFVPFTPDFSMPGPGSAFQGVPGPGIVMAGQGPQDQQERPRRRESGKAVYDREIVRLRAIVDSGRHRLDPATVALLDKNLKIIDTAIEQCQEALTRDSASAFLLESLNNAYQMKVKLLRVAAAAASRG